MLGTTQLEGSYAERDLEDLSMAHMPKTPDGLPRNIKNNKQVDQATRTEVAQVDLDWEHKGELLVTLWAHETLGQLERHKTYRWTHDQGMDLTVKVTTLVTHEDETCHNQVIHMNKVSLEQRVVAGMSVW